MKLNIGFFLREALRNIRSNWLMSVTAVTTTFICILVLGAGLVLSAHIEGIIGSVRGDVGVTAFFSQDAKQKEIDEARKTAEGYSEVSSVKYVSEQQALDEFKATFKEQPEIYEDIGADVLPAKLELKLEDPAAADTVADKLKTEGFAAGDLRYPQQTIDRVNDVTGYMVFGLRAATVLFLISSVLLISNAIRLSIFARRKEIEVMKLVGASDGFVRTPFVFEGLMQGLIGAALAAISVVWLNLLFVDWARNQIPFFQISGDSVNTLLILGVLLLVGAVIGVLGSFLSVTRFLRV